MADSFRLPNDEAIIVGGTHPRMPRHLIRGERAASGGLPRTSIRFFSVVTGHWPVLYRSFPKIFG